MAWCRICPYCGLTMDGIHLGIVIATAYRLTGEGLEVALCEGVALVVPSVPKTPMLVCHSAGIVPLATAHEFVLARQIMGHDTPVAIVMTTQKAPMLECGLSRDFSPRREL